MSNLPTFESKDFSSTNSKIPLVALIGLPNSGKSTLINRICGFRKAITANEAGTTRDLTFGEDSWENMYFRLVDTGGLEVNPIGDIKKLTQIKTLSAIAESDLLVWVIDRRQNPDTISLEIAQKVWKLGKPFIIGINKVDSPNAEKDISEYAKLGGIGFVNFSAASGFGIGDLLDIIVENLEKIGFNKKTDFSIDQSEIEKLEQKRRGKKAIGKSQIVRQNADGTYFVTRENTKHGPGNFQAINKEDLENFEEKRAKQPIENLIFDFYQVLFDQDVAGFIDYLCQESPRTRDELQEIIKSQIENEHQKIENKTGVNFEFINKKMSQNFANIDQKIEQINQNDLIDKMENPEIDKLTAEIERIIESKFLGQINWEEFWIQIQKVTQINDLSWDVWDDWTIVLDETETFLKSQKELGKKIYYLTNILPQNYKRRKEEEIYGYFDGGIASCTLGIKKPDKAIFEELIRKYKLEVSKTVFIDDNEENVKAAREIGFWAIQYIHGFTDLSAEMNKIESGKALQKPKIPKILFLGKPNVGKSSLFNALARENLQIITSTAGTTLSVNDTMIERNIRIDKKIEENLNKKLEQKLATEIAHEKLQKEQAILNLREKMGFETDKGEDEDDFDDTFGEDYGENFVE